VSHQAYARRYIWNRFKYSALTLVGVLLPSFSSLAMMVADWPVNLQLLNVVTLLGMVGISYWWHWFYRVEELAQAGVAEYMEQEAEARHKGLLASFEAIDLAPYPTYEALKIDLKQKYAAFGNALAKQRIISDTARSHFAAKAQQAFDSGIALLTEMGDILVVQSSVNIGSIREQHDRQSGAEKERLRQIMEAYGDNEAKLARLAESLRTLNHSYVLAISHLASLTSKTHEKEDFEALELQEAIDAAKVVKEKLHARSGQRQSGLEAIHARYADQTNQPKE
jgi:hypothetical protein